MHTSKQPAKSDTPQAGQFKDLPKGKRILLVEDSPDNQILIQHFLSDSGAEVTIANNGREGSKVPVIALTAHALREERDRAQRAGFDDYLTKPISKKTLVEKLVSWLQVST